MADKTVIVEIQYDTDQAMKNIVALSDAIEVQKTKQKALKENLESGAISWKQYNEELVKSQISTSKANEQKKTEVKLFAAEKGSIDAIRAKISQLTRERNALGDATGKNKAKITELNKELDKHNKVLDSVSDKTLLQKRNIGNYGDALKALPGPLGGVASSIMGMTKASLAFIATGIGAVIAVIGLALGALIKYFKGSEEGQNNLNKVMAVFKVIAGNVGDIVQKVGKWIFEAVSKPKEAIKEIGELIKENLINRFKAFGVMGEAIAKIFKGDFKEGFKQLAEGGVQAVTGVTDAFEKMGNAVTFVKDQIKETNAEIAIAKKLADQQAKLDKRVRAEIINDAKDQAKIAELRASAAQKDKFNGEQRLAMLEEAIAIENAMLVDDLEIAKQKAQIHAQQIAMSNSTKEDLDEQARLEAEIFNLQKRNAEALRGFERQRQSALNDIAADKALLADAELNIDDLIFENFAQGMADQDKLVKESIETRRKLRGEEHEEEKELRRDAFASLAEGTAMITDLMTSSQDKELSNLQKNKEKELKLAGDNKTAQDAINRKFAKKENELKKKQFNTEKVKSIVEGTIATILAVLKAGVITPQAILAGIMGGAGVAAIAAKKYEPIFAEGGAIIGGESHANGGTHFVGSDGSRFVAEKGEAMFIMKKDATAEIAALSAINESFGGRSWTSKPASHLAEGGQAEAVSVARQVSEEFQRTPIIVKVSDVLTGMTSVEKVKQAGVI